MGSSTQSGAAPEIAGGARELGEIFQSIFQQKFSERTAEGGEDALGNFFALLQQPFLNVQGDTQRRILGGITPDSAGLPSAINRSLTDPADRTAGLFAALQPFEDRQVTQQIGGCEKSSVAVVVGSPGTWRMQRSRHVANCQASLHVRDRKPCSRLVISRTQRSRTC